MKKISLGIAGLGTVAQGVLSIIAQHKNLIAARSGIELSVSRVASRSPKPEVDLLGAQFSTDLNDLVTSDDVDIVLELIGGEDAALQLIRSCKAKGKALVTANKAVIANFGNELLGADNTTPIRFEAAVAGAIPIVQAIQQGLVANQFEHVMGIINGTCNYILTAMQSQGAAFDDALATAQELGYAEADPTFDVEGIDAAHKLTILLALAFDSPFNFADVYVEGISKVSAADIEYADQLGYCIKHIGLARQSETGLEARVHPTLLPKDQLLAHVNDVANAVLVRSDAAGDTLFSGPGAGGAATASAVLADVVSLAKQMPQADFPRQSSGHLGILNISEVLSEHYLRIPVQDQPGVFAGVANTLSQHNISIEATIQKEPRRGQDLVDIVILTQAVKEAEIAAAVAELEQLPHISGAISRIRVESFD